MIATNATTACVSERLWNETTVTKANYYETAYVKS